MNIQETVRFMNDCGLEPRILDPAISNFKGDEVLSCYVGEDDLFYLARRGKTIAFKYSKDVVSFWLDFDDFQPACEFVCAMFTGDPVITADLVIPKELNNKLSQVGLQNLWGESEDMPTPAIWTAPHGIDLPGVSRYWEAETKQLRNELEADLRQAYFIYNKGGIIMTMTYSNFKNQGLLCCSTRLDPAIEAICKFHQSKQLPELNDIVKL